jgi:hypothetical protein
VAAVAGGDPFAVEMELQSGAGAASPKLELKMGIFHLPELELKVVAGAEVQLRGAAAEAGGGQEGGDLRAGRGRQPGRSHDARGCTLGKLVYQLPLYFNGVIPMRMFCLLQSSVLLLRMFCLLQSFNTLYVLLAAIDFNF